MFHRKVTLFEPPTQTGVDDVHAHPRHLGRPRLDLILALTALLISAVSLYVAIDHGRTERELVHENAQLVQAASWPFLQIDSAFSDNRDSEVHLTNAGVGPAKLFSLRVFLDNKPVADLHKLLQQCCDLPTDKAAERSLLPNGLPISTIKNEVFRPGESEMAIRIPASRDNNTLGRRYAAEAHRITFEACYCSVFDVCWLSTLSSLEPRPVGRCEAVESFNQDEN